MAVTSTHIAASLRLIDAENRGLGTLGRVRPDLNAADVASLIGGINVIRVTPVANAALTVQSELKEA